MPDSIIVAEAPVPSLEGDAQVLARRLVAPAGLSLFASVHHTLPAQVCDVPTLRGFLSWYRTEMLTKLELPAIRTAWEHTTRYEVRELLACDQSLAAEPRLRRLAAASQAVGRSQLRRLLPMRDQRLVQRYWRAVESGNARAWHLLVYGVVLSVFSLPLRPGLLSYSRATLGGFVHAAGRSLRLSEATCAQLWYDEAALLTPAVDLALGPGRTPLRLSD